MKTIKSLPACFYLIPAYKGPCLAMHMRRDRGHDLRYWTIKTDGVATGGMFCSHPIRKEIFH